MHPKKLFICGLAVLALLLAASCGPSPEEQAATAVALTAAAATDTPTPTNTPTPTDTPAPTSTPTPTPTPIPYDLTVLVTGLDDAPVAGASVTLAELEGAAGTQITDDAGQTTWTDLPGDTATLAVTAQGYFPAEVAETIERGPNEVVVPLERDPFGLLPSEACASDETLLYIEDFQDGQAEGWPEIQLNAPGWALGPHPDETSNTVISGQFSESLGGEPVWANLQGYSFDNAVWRIRFMIVGQGEVSFNWRFALEPYEVEGTEVFDSRYQIPIGTLNPPAIRRLQQPVLNIEVARGFRSPTSGEWHYLEISTYDGATEVWMDGLQIMAYEDPQPLKAGGVSLEFWPPDETTIVYFDDISVCELSAPFASMPTAESAPAPSDTPVPVATPVPTDTPIPPTAPPPTPTSAPEAVTVPPDPWGQVVVPPGDTIHIGLVADFSGGASQVGPVKKNAVQMAIDDQDSVKGFPLSITVADGGCPDGMGATAAQTMVADPSIVGVIGHTCSVSCMEGAPVYEGAHLVMISPSCGAPDLSGLGYQVFNRVYIRDDQGADEQVRQMVNTNAYQDFAHRYQSRYGQPLDREGLDVLAAYSYDATNILMRAIEQVAVVDGAGNLVIGRQALANAVRATSGYQGVTGAISFDGQGDRLP